MNSRVRSRPLITLKRGVPVTTAAPLQVGQLALSLQEKQNIIFGVDALGTPNLRVASRALGFTVSTLSRILKERQYVQAAVQASQTVKVKKNNREWEETKRRNSPKKTTRMMTTTLHQTTTKRYSGMGGMGTTRIGTIHQVITHTHVPKMLLDNTVTLESLKYTPRKKAYIRRRLQQEGLTTVSMDLGISVSTLSCILKEGRINNNNNTVTTTTTTGPGSKIHHKRLLCREGRGTTSTTNAKRTTHWHS